MSKTVVIGPMLTAFGFRSWYWVCRPSMLVAIPGGFWVAIKTTIIIAGFGGVVADPGTEEVQKAGGPLVKRLQTASGEELVRMAGAVVYRTTDLESIVCKRWVLGTNPDFIVTTTHGKRTKYGLGNVFAFDAVVDALRGCYGERVQGP